eukprot:6196016-Pleurochrysis_carterae.AAC.1
MQRKQLFFEAKTFAPQPGHCQSPGRTSDIAVAMLPPPPPRARGAGLACKPCARCTGAVNMWYRSLESEGAI